MMKGVFRRLCYLGGGMIISAVTLYAHFILSRELEVSSYGQFGLYLGMLSITVPFVMMGQALAFGTAYFADERNGKPYYRSDFNRSLFLMVIACFVLLSILFFCFLLDIYPVEPKYLFFLVATAIAIAFKDFFISALVTMDEFIIYLLVAFSYAAVFVSIIYTQRTLESFFIATVASSIIAINFAALISYKNIEKSKNNNSGLYRMKTLFLLGWPSIPGVLVSSLNAYVDRFMLGALMTLEQVAFYTLASTLSVGIGNLLVISLLRGDVVSLRKSLQRRSKLDYEKTSNHVLLLISVLALLAFLLNYTVGETLVEYVFGLRYLDSYTLMLPLFLIILLNGCSQVSSQVLIQKKKSDIILCVSVFSVLVNAVLNYVFISYLGILGALVAFILATFFYYFIIIFFARKLSDYVVYPVKSTLLLMLLLVSSLFYGL